MRKERTQLILCTTEDGQSHIQSRADGGTVWLSGDREYAEAQGLKRAVDNCTTHRRLLEAAKKSADSE